MDKLLSSIMFGFIICAIVVMFTFAAIALIVITYATLPYSLGFWACVAGMSTYIYKQW